MANQLQFETSPYLLQHKDNPVQWYPWCQEAFQRAKKEDKPIFLSIGYSTCHWCHVMAHESFEDKEIADLLNQRFISIKVDREERPDIDSIYMSVCQAFTGSGGWPTSIFMTADQKPFFAGTYFPKDTRGPMLGLRQLLILIQEAWETNRSQLLQQAEEILTHLDQSPASGHASHQLIDEGIKMFKRYFDRENGGFGMAPKFPTPHNLLFLLAYYERYHDKECLNIVEKTLLQMYRGGLFDHIGFGFCRYSTDKYFLVPHFEKMLYDNALLILAYCKAYTVTHNKLYLEIAQKTADYILREMTSPEGGFYSAQDADSDGEEGKYYLFTPEEVADLLGDKMGRAFNQHFGITKKDKNIPHLLRSDPLDKTFDFLLPQVAAYRKNRYHLHLDDKILTSWNSLMIAAMCQLYRVTSDPVYLEIAKKADHFIQNNLLQDNTLFVSFRAAKRGVPGFLDDYSGYIFAQLALYDATLEERYLTRAKELCEYVFDSFEADNGGFYMTSQNSESLILRVKETYDGAIPSGNSLMAWNLVRLSHPKAATQLDFLAGEAGDQLSGHAMFLLSLLEYYEPPRKITIVLADPADNPTLPSDAIITLLHQPTQEYPLLNNKTTYYVCQGHSCQPPVNELSE